MLDASSGFVVNLAATATLLSRAGVLTVRLDAVVVVVVLTAPTVAKLFVLARLA